MDPDTPTPTYRTPSPETPIAFDTPSRTTLQRGGRRLSDISMLTASDMGMRTS